MNLPQGVLRERLRLAFAKATRTFDEFDLLSIVGRSQVGRIRYTGDKEHLHEEVPFQSVDEILGPQARPRPLPLPAGEIRVLFRDQRRTRMRAAPWQALQSASGVRTAKDCGSRLKWIPDEQTIPS